MHLVFCCSEERQQIRFDADLYFPSNDAGHVGDSPNNQLLQERADNFNRMVQKGSDLEMFGVSPCLDAQVRPGTFAFRAMLWLSH